MSTSVCAIKIANETGLPKDITDKMLKQETKDLIINSAKLNPRNIKRFINSLVLSYSTSGKNIQDIYTIFMSLISDSIASVPFLFAFALEYLPFLIQVSLLYGLSILILASQFH
jgi:hypothetical protein